MSLGFDGNPMNDPEVRQAAAALEDELAGLAERQKQCEAEARGLLEREAEGQGPFASEIYELKQTKQMLATEAMHVRAKLNRLLLGDPPPAPVCQDACQGE